MDVDVLTCTGAHLDPRAAGLVTNLNPPRLPNFPRMAHEVIAILFLVVIAHSLLSILID